jgi:CheY-like chemotaxis protein
MKPIHILQVEDDENDVFFLHHAFQEVGIQNPIHVVRDGQEAMDYLSGQGKYSDRSRYPVPGLVILDLQIPRRTGTEVLAWLRKQPDVCCVPVIVYSASSQQSDVDALYRLGANAYVVKPPSMDEQVEFARQIKGFWLHFNEPPSRSAVVENGASGAVSEVPARFTWKP